MGDRVKPGTADDDTVRAELAGKTVVVLGASSPHGVAAVRALAGEGANLALGGRSREKLEALAQQAEALGGRAIVVGTHLAKRHHPAHLVRAAVEAFGGLDGLVYLASAGAPPLSSLDVDSWERSLEVNLKGFVYCLAAALPAMLDGGRVVVAGVRATDPLFRASRAAVRAILEEIPQEFSSPNVHTAEVRAESPEECAKAVIHTFRE